jgi:hypothetical protein
MSLSIENDTGGIYNRGVLRGWLSVHVWLVISLCTFMLAILCLSPMYAAEALGVPGVGSSWTSGAKDGIGTAPPVPAGTVATILFAAGDASSGNAMLDYLLDVQR